MRLYASTSDLPTQSNLLDKLKADLIVSFNTAFIRSSFRVNYSMYNKVILYNHILI